MDGRKAASMYCTAVRACIAGCSALLRVSIRSTLKLYSVEHVVLVK
jgi:hypothetical protein